MKSNLSLLVLTMAGALLMCGCSGLHADRKWEYKVAQAPGTWDANTARGPLAAGEKYLNELGQEGWILVSEHQGVYYLMRPAK